MNAAGLDLLKSFESCRLTAYLDGAGVVTLGWGHTGPDVSILDTCTQEQADAWLVEDVAHTETELGHMLIAPVTSNPFAALVCLGYNIGVGALHQSTLLKFVNDGDAAQAVEQFLRWDHIAGAESAGLLRRRQAERDLFLTPDIIETAVRSALDGTGLG